MEQQQLNPLKIYFSKNKGKSLYNHKNNFIIVDKDITINEVKEMPFEEIKPLEKRVVERLTFVIEISNQCPMNCEYCFVALPNRAEQVLSLENIDLFAELITKLSEKAEITIDIHDDGVNRGKIHYLLSKLSKTKNVSFGIQTSGYAVDKDFIKFCKEYSISLGISIDTVKDSYRKNTVAIKALDLLKEENMPCGLITVVNKENQDRLFKDFVKLSSNYLLKGIYYNMVVHKDNKFLPEPKTAALEVIKIADYVLENNLDITINPIKTISCRLLGQYDSLCYAAGCGAYKRIFALGADGSLYGCDTFINQFNPLNIKEFKDAEKYSGEISVVVESIKDILGCEKCGYFSLCRIPCAGKAFLAEYSTDSLKSSCEFNKILIEYGIGKAMENKAAIRKFSGIFKNKDIEPKNLFYTTALKGMKLEGMLK